MDQSKPPSGHYIFISVVQSAPTVVNYGVPDPETSGHSPLDLGTARHGVFPTTHWSAVLAAGESAGARVASALEELCRNYWQPVYAFIRRSGANPEDARDLTQAFFADLLSGNAFKRANPELGRFRSYLLGVLKHFLADEYDHSRALKRGGGIEFVPIDVLLAESRYGFELSTESASLAYDRAWAMAVLDRALSRLREEFTLSGRAALFDGLKGFLLGDRGDLTFAGVAEELRITEGAAKMTVTRMRQRFRALVRQELAQTVGTSAELEEELRAFAEALRG
jgi:RNA polymerase sigma-70 factor (ECF subfamily)